MLVCLGEHVVPAVAEYFSSKILSAVCVFSLWQSFLPRCESFLSDAKLPDDVAAGCPDTCVLGATRNSADAAGFMN